MPVVGMPSIWPESSKDTSTVAGSTEVTLRTSLLPFVSPSCSPSMRSLSCFWIWGCGPGEGEILRLRGQGRLPPRGGKPIRRFWPVGLERRCEWARRSAGEDGAAVDVEDFAGDEAGQRRAEEEDGAGDLLHVGGGGGGGVVRRGGGPGGGGGGVGGGGGGGGGKGGGFFWGGPRGGGGGVA